MNQLRQYTFQSSEVLLTVYAHNESDAWMKAESTAVAEVARGPLELVDVELYDPGDADGAD